MIYVGHFKLDGPIPDQHNFVADVTVQSGLADDREFRVTFHPRNADGSRDTAAVQYVKIPAYGSATVRMAVNAAFEALDIDVAVSATIDGRAAKVHLPYYGG